MLSQVELKYSIVNLSGTWRIQHQRINTLLITVGSHYDAIISNGHITIPYSPSSKSKYFIRHYFLTFSEATHMKFSTKLSKGKEKVKFKV